MNQKVHKIEISYRTTVFTVIFLALLWFLYYIRAVIFQIFIALLIMTILNPTVTKLQKLKVPRVVSVLLVYTLVLGSLSLFVVLMAPPLAEQTTNFVSLLPKYLEELKIPPFIAEQVTKEITSSLGSLSSQIIKIGVSVLSNIMSVIAVFVFALYFLLAREKLDEQVSTLFHDGQNAKKIERFIDRLEDKLGGWARGQIILMFLVGLATYLGLIIIKIPFALPLALLAGILEIVPGIGPVVAGIIPALIGFGISPLTGLAAAALGVLVQQLENYLLVPKVMEKSAGVSPIITLLSLLIGFKVAGIIGAMLSIPVVITIQILFEEFVFSRKHP